MINSMWLYYVHFDHWTFYIIQGNGQSLTSCNTTNISNLQNFLVSVFMLTNACKPFALLYGVQILTLTCALVNFHATSSLVKILHLSIFSFYIFQHCVFNFPSVVETHLSQRSYLLIDLTSSKLFKWPLNLDAASYHGCWTKI